MGQITIPPVAIFVFNRPDFTAQVLKAVGAAKPQRLYVVVDGPRLNHEDDAQKIQQVLKVIESVDWDCKVFVNQSETNLGLYERIVSGINWVFETESRAIFLEDDCVGTEDFFRFCSEMLEMYSADPRVGSVSGSYLGIKPPGPPNSYHFNSHTYIWGWATWARAWKDFASREDTWGQLSDVQKKQIFRKSVPFFWQRLFWRRLVRTKAFDENWDFQWVVTQWMNSRLSVEPNVNLVRNIGFGEGATHTKESGDILGQLKTGRLHYPLVHPPQVERDLGAMKNIQTVFRISNLTRHFQSLTRVMLRLFGPNTNH